MAKKKRKEPPFKPTKVKKLPLPKGKPVPKPKKAKKFKLRSVCPSC